MAEWQMCAAQGKLPGQNSHGIHFAVPPQTLSMAPSEGVFGTYSGFGDAPCQMPWVGFANDDIYYLEVCLFSQVTVCSNREKLFELTPMDSFVCGLDSEGLRELQELLLAGAASSLPPPTSCAATPRFLHLPRPGTASSTLPSSSSSSSVSQSLSLTLGTRLGMLLSELSDASAYYGGNGGRG